MDHNKFNFQFDQLLLRDKQSWLDHYQDNAAYFCDTDISPEQYAMLCVLSTIETFDVYEYGTDAINAHIQRILALHQLNDDQYQACKEINVKIYFDFLG